MRVQIIGGPGTGKSTLSADLAERLKLPLLSSDGYLWADEDFTHARTEAEITALLQADLARHPDFVFDGQPDAKAPSVGLKADILVLLLMDEPSRMARLAAREQARFGSRIAPGGDLYQSSREFLSWAATYKTAEGVVGTYLCHHIKMYNAFGGGKLVLDGGLGTDAQIKHIFDCLGGL